MVGRVPPADLVVPDASLSRAHAQFVQVGDEVVVRDLGSTNGTWVGGRSIETATLRSGDVATIGSVAAVIQSVGYGGGRLGLDGHDRFSAILDREVARARHFDRPVALVMMRAANREHKLHFWVQRVIELLRPIDCAAVYGAGVVEIVMPEAGLSEALAWARAVIAASSKGKPPVDILCGLSAFPESSTSADWLIESCHRALQSADSGRRFVAAPSTVVSQAQSQGAGGLVTTSEAMQQLLDVAKRVARSHIPVLLHGETGTGKEVLARVIHGGGPRAEKPMVAVNCAAIPASLVESTLFGHEKGAFTGANQAHPGVFEAAHGGTLLLDEIGELPAAPQAALLRVLENRTITRVGSTKEKEVDVRIIAASHRDLEQMSKDGAFREDLFYRLNAVVLDIPPLRDRRSDILPLALEFLEQANAANGCGVKGVDRDAEIALDRYHWPGNIRELRNVIERGVVITEGATLGVADLPARVRNPGSVSSLPPEPAVPVASAAQGAVRQEGECFRACMERLEVQVISEALEAAGGNQSEAARQLGMPRRTLVHKIKVLNIKK